MVNYQNSKIYRLVCNKTNQQYIGSTTRDYLRTRLQQHRASYNMFLQGKETKKLTSFKILENNDYDIVLIEDFPCDSKEQLHARERYWIENTECVNHFIPTRTLKEYYEDNKDKVIESSKKYYIENKDKVKEYQKKYREEHKQYFNNYYAKNKEQVKCECGCIVNKFVLSRHKKTKRHLNYLEFQQQG